MKCYNIKAKKCSTLKLIQTTKRAEGSVSWLRAGRAEGSGTCMVESQPETLPEASHGC